MKKSIIVAPSVLSANFINLNKDLQKCVDAGIQWIHYDVMDFDFVPNLTFGAKVLNDIVKNFNFKIDIHFMVKVKTANFADFFADYINCKPTMMTMHVESLNKSQVDEFIALCQANNIIPSLAVSPDTPIHVLDEFLPKLANILVMSVYPGFGGQEFISEVLQKIIYLKTQKQLHGYSYTIEIDGGINQETSKLALNAGVDMLVAGSYLFESEDFQLKVDSLYA